MIFVFDQFVVCLALRSPESSREIVRMAEVAQWFNEIPPITRHWFGLSLLFPILGGLSLTMLQEELASRFGILLKIELKLY